MVAHKTSKAMISEMAPASRASLTQSLKFQESCSVDDALNTAKQSYEFVNIVYGNSLLLRSLTDPAQESAQRAAMVEALFRKKLSDATLEILKDMVGLKWSIPEDFLIAVEVVAANSAFSVAELREKADGRKTQGLAGLEKVEDAVLAFRRLLIEDSRLDRAFADDRADVEAKQKLVSRLVPQAGEVTKLLLGQATAYPRGYRVAQRIDQLVELLNARQKRWLAEVKTSVVLGETQRKRLQESLSAIYERQLKLDVSLDRELLGGLRIRVGDELIDGSVAARISRMQQQLESTV